MRFNHSETLESSIKCIDPFKTEKIYIDGGFQDPANWNNDINNTTTNKKQQ